MVWWVVATIGPIGPPGWPVGKVTGDAGPAENEVPSLILIVAPVAVNVSDDTPKASRSVGTRSGSTRTRPSPTVTERSQVDPGAATLGSVHDRAELSNQTTRPPVGA